jgi:glycoside/pentoside/hexuronide:cation symporter, GPH family
MDTDRQAINRDGEPVPAADLRLDDGMYQTASIVSDPVDDGRPPRLPFLLNLGWGLGTLGLTAFMVGSYLMLRFMTDFMAMPPALAGTIFALAKIYDGIADPIFGSISDRTHSRWGRRRPFLLAGAFACALAFMLAFNAPVVTDRTTAVVMLVALLLLNSTAYAIFAVPYMAMPAEMTDDPAARSTLMSFRVVNGALGNLVGGWATASLIALFGGGLFGHRMMGLVVGLAIFVILYASFHLTRPARRRDAGGLGHVPYREQLRTAARNRPFVILQAAKLMLLGAAGLHTASAAFFVQRRLDMSDAWLGIIYATLTIGTVIGQPFWLRMARRHGKRGTYVAGGLYTALTWLAWLPLGPGSAPAAIVVVGLLAGLGNGGIVMISQSMLPDTIEYQYRTNGLRIEGSFAGVYIMVEKLGQAIGVSLTGLILGAFGYIEAHAGARVVQPPSAVLGITLVYSVFSTLFLLCSVAIILAYPLDERTMTLRGARRG